MPAKLGKYLADRKQSKDDVSRQIGGREATRSLFKILQKEELELRDRYVIIKSRPIYSGGNDSFILGHSLNGVLGSTTGIGGNTVVLGDFKGSWTTERIVQPQTTYREWFYDTEFKDAGNTTANWNDTNHEVSFE